MSNRYARPKFRWFAAIFARLCRLLLTTTQYLGMHKKQFQRVVNASRILEWLLSPTIRSGEPSYKVSGLVKLWRYSIFLFLELLIKSKYFFLANIMSLARFKQTRNCIWGFLLKVQSITRFFFVYYCSKYHLFHSFILGINMPTFWLYWWYSFEYLLLEMTFSSVFADVI